MYLSAIERRSAARPEVGFPWSLPLIQRLERLEFGAPVTFLVGENGSGKSTVLEGLAAGMDAVAAGSHDLARDESLAAARALARGYRFVRRRHTRTRLFLRAEDVFGFTHRVAREIDAFREMEAGFERELPEGGGRTRAMGMAAAQRRALAGRYGENPDGRSHGETFLALLATRLTPGGLYFLDEPEAPLSPARVLSLLALLKDRVEHDCQFIVATHSPILMALPEATILHFESDTVRPVAWDEVEHVRLTRDFLADPGRFLRHL
jgi:predicted ATPase